jgi:hypothetical protein
MTEHLIFLVVDSMQLALTASDVDDGMHITMISIDV